jgi:hypothetical protein
MEVFMLRKNDLHGAKLFYTMMLIFFIFLMQVMQMQEVNMDKYRITSRRGSGILSLLNQTSLLFIL